jgi:acetylornithine deacetylase
MLPNLLRDLVRIPSVNPMGRALTGPIYFEHGVTAYLEDFFRKLGVPYERQPVAPLRENIIARYESPGSRRTILFEAHQDTVPAEHMTIEPFAGEVNNGRLYGRGACDIKGGMAAMLAAFARLTKEKPPGAASVVMACTVDEEFTFKGITELVRRGVKADMAIVAEPTNLDIVNAHKGVVRWVITTPGRSCHSSSPEQGVNAIYRMGQVLTAIERFAGVLRNSRSDPVLGPPTISVGLISGGQSVNIVPDQCRIEVDRRVITGEDPLASTGELEAFLRNEAKIDFPVNIDKPWMSLPALSPKGSDELVERLGNAIQSVRGSRKVKAVPYGTDASSLQQAGIPSVVFGPGDIAQAHTCDEWVPLDEVEAAAEILYRVAAA